MECVTGAVRGVEELIGLQVVVVMMMMMMMMMMMIKLEVMSLICTSMTVRHGVL